MSIDFATAVEDFWSARARGEFFPQAYFDRLTWTRRTESSLR